MENDIFLFIVEWFLDDEEDEKPEISSRLAKIKNYAEEIVPNYSTKQFQSHFRMTPTTFQTIINKIHNIEAERHTENQKNPEITVEKQLLLTLWYLANLECYRSVADRFGVSTSTAWHCVYKICKKLLLLQNHCKIISFPNDEQSRYLAAENFERRNGFPGILGAIDGSHISIKAPKISPTSYINRKNYHSVLLQGICNHKKKFLDVYAGEAGSIHDACLFRRSQFGQTLVNRQWPQDLHLIGDSAYPLHINLLVPFKDNGHLTRIQKKYNEKLSQNRVVIEHAFALLKGRFRKLKLLDCTRMDIIPLVIIAACVLHNICLASNDIPNDIELHNELEEEHIMNPHNLNPDENNVPRDLAAAKRNNIAFLLQENNHLHQL